MLWQQFSHRGTVQPMEGDWVLCQWFSLSDPQSFKAKVTLLKVYEMPLLLLAGRFLSVLAGRGMMPHPQEWSSSPIAKKLQWQLPTPCGLHSGVIISWLFFCPMAMSRSKWAPSTHISKSLVLRLHNRASFALHTEPCAVQNLSMLSASWTTSIDKLAMKMYRGRWCDLRLSTFSERRCLGRGRDASKLLSFRLH